ncbi:MAG: leucine-rich repeat protein, partial [Clostridia bacterium]|nr:leucine-rich repeat protein [Clostridia bacterium]
VRLDSEKPNAEAQTSEEIGFKEVTGQFNLSAVTLENLNKSIVQAVTGKKEKSTVIVSLKGDSLIDAANGRDVPEYVATNEAQKAAKKIEEKQNAFLRRLKGNGISYLLKDRYSTIDNALAIEINVSDAPSIREMPEVQSLVFSNSYAVPKTVEGSGSSQTAVTNETTVHKTGIYDSTGYTEYSKGAVVAILDTGLDYTHPAYQQLPPAETLGLNKTAVQTLLETKAFAAETRSGTLEVSDVYVSDKVPFAYDYADDDPDVYPSYSNHGTHVAGIVGGYDESGYTNKDGEHVAETFTGVAPDSQLVICKVFTDDLEDEDLGGAVTEDILAALEDCVLLGVDVINMSLGQSAGFSKQGGDDEGDYLDIVYNSIKTAGISLICAASNDYSSAYGGTFGTNLTSNPDSATVGSPSTYAAALSVASISGQKSEYVIANKGTQYETPVYYMEAHDQYSNNIDFADGLLGKDQSVTTGEFEYVVVPGTGLASDYSAQVKRLFNEKPYERIALIKRGVSTFEEKVEIAMQNKAGAVIVYNNVAGEIRMALGEVENPVPSISIDREAGEAMLKVVTKSNRIGKITIDRSLSAGPFMSDFSSWGPTPDLKLKPEITAHGGEITSTVPGGYGEQSGTSMASPNMAGVTALTRNYIKQELGSVIDVSSAVQVNRLANQMMMSTATIAYDEDNLPYSPRKQGAGLASLENIIHTGAYLYTENAENDNRPKIELGDMLQEKDEYELEFFVHNFSSVAKTFTLQSLVMTESVDYDGFAVAEQAYMLNDNQTVWYVGDSAEPSSATLSVNAGEKVKIKAVVSLSAEEKEYIEENFKNGMYVEGFIRLVSEEDGQCSLTLPFLGFYGDWSKAPMLDLDVFEVTADEKDDSIEEEDKRQESVWPTQAFASYYNEDFIIPMGSYVYVLPDEADEMWPEEEHGAISRYNNFYGDDAENNYMTTTSVKAVYAGLLRNARTVNYTLSNAYTGEILKTDTINRVAKAHTSGGSTVPANVELELYPEESGLMSNGKYKMTFEFLLDYKDGTANDNVYEFTFYVDYDAPVLEDVRVRYDNYKEGTKEKQKIYLEFDVFDNHYPQSLMLCYLDEEYSFEAKKEENVLKLATEYVTPIRNAKKNQKTTVSVEVTDFYEKYKSGLYVQIDDYALNNSLWQIMPNKVLDASTPDTFELAEGEETVTVDVYGTHKVSLVYEGNADLSNFKWESKAPNYVAVKNGEIVGLQSTQNLQDPVRVVVSNGKVSRYINVNVTSTVKRLGIPSISFGEMQAMNDWLTKAQGLVEVYSNSSFKLDVVADPWYYPTSELELLWESKNTDIAEVDQNGNVITKQKGVTSIIAYLCENGKPTNFSANVQLRVVDDFTIQNYTLSVYRGVGYNGVECPHCHSAWEYRELETVEIDGQKVIGVCPTPACRAAGKVIRDCEDVLLKVPADRNVMYIGENAFKNNDNVVKLVLPESLMEIQKRAFLNCSALKEVYFVDTVKKEIANADLSMIREEAFYYCQNLELLDFSNNKTFTVAMSAFKDCVSLEEVKYAKNIGTMHDRAFSGCTSLTAIDLSGLHMSGKYVFENCSSLAEVTTGRFTAIGPYMFVGCNSMEEITVHTPKVGEGAFRNCTGLQRVKFETKAGEVPVAFAIGASAFEGCTALTEVDFGTETVRSIGRSAFANTALTTFALPSGLEVLGGGFVNGTGVVEVALSDSLNLSAIRLENFLSQNVMWTVPQSSSVYYQDPNSGFIYTADKSVLLMAYSANGDVVFPSDVQSALKEIKEYAFAGSNINSVAIPAGVEKIGVGAFKNSTLAAVSFAGNSITEIAESTFENTALTQVALPASVQTIGVNAYKGSAISGITAQSFQGTVVNSYAFADCKDLTSVAFAQTVKTFGDGVLSGCSNLETAELPALTKVGDYTFYGCSSLNEASFAEGATELGGWTFTGSSVRKVTLPSTVTEIKAGERFVLGTNVLFTGAFAGCVSLQEIDLGGVTNIGTAAFFGCTNLATVTGLAGVQTVGDYAFYNCNALTALNLAAAENIGKFAFAVQNGGAAYQSVLMPLVESIGAYAFEGGAMSEVSLPATLLSVGDGAFRGAKNLATITVAEGNPVLTTTVNGTAGNVLFAKENGQYKLLCYPAALVAAKVEGKATYVVPDYTVSIQSGAFGNLNAGALEKVVLPFSLKTIDNGAFMGSGVLEYVFESVNAPVLETEYDALTAEWFYTYADQNYTRPFYGFFYTNFDGKFANYTDYIGQESALKISYPVNGVGYDNFTYRTYFGEKALTTEVMDDTTRAFITAMSALPTLETVGGWKTYAAGNLALVTDTAELLSSARAYFNAIKSETQRAFLPASSESNLLAYEELMRSVKPVYGISVSIARVAYDGLSYKKEYVVGETFDPTGLKIIVYYSDGSSVVADGSEFTLLTTRALKLTDNYVELQGYGRTVMVDVRVNEAPVVPDNGESGEPADEGCGGVIGVNGVWIVAVLALTTVVILKKKEQKA